MFHLLEELIEHPIVDLAGPRAVQFVDLVSVRTEGVERPELATGVAEQHQEVLALGAVDLLQHAALGFPVHSAGKHAVLHRVQHYAAVGFGGRLLVQTGTWRWTNY